MSDWKQLELFQREANTLKQLQHPGIPRYVADFEDDTEKDRGYYLVQVSGLAKLQSASSFLLHGHSLSCAPVVQYQVCIAALAKGNKDAWSCSLIFPAMTLCAWNCVKCHTFVHASHLIMAHDQDICVTTHGTLLHLSIFGQ